MKKLFALLMVCGFALAFVACGGKKDGGSGQDSTTVAAPDTTTVAAPDTTRLDTVK